MTSIKIQPIQVQKTVNNESEFINHFLEKIQDTKKPSLPFDGIIEAIKHTQGALLIYTSKIISSELDHLFKKLRDQDKRIYLILEDKTFTQISKNPYPEVIIRSGNNITSTFILIDPKHPSIAKGYWSPLPLSKQNKFYLELTSPQIKAFYHFFIQYFWEYTNPKEIILGKIQETKPPIQAPYDESRLTYSKIIKEKDLNFLEQEYREPNTIWLTRSEITEFLDNMDYEDLLLLENAKSISLHKSMVLKKLLDEQGLLDNPEKTIFISEFPVTTIMFNEGLWLVNNDMMIKINNGQRKDIETWETKQWQYHVKKPIKNIHSEICLEHEDWSNPEHHTISIQDTINVTLSDIQTNTIDEYIEEYTKSLKSLPNKQPEFPKEIQYAKKIMYQWQINPPYLPANAKKHDLYTKWPTNLNNMINVITTLNKFINTTLEFHENGHTKRHKDTKKKIDKKKKSWSKWTKTNDELKQYLQTLHETTKNNIQAITPEIKTELLEKIKQYNTLLEQEFPEISEIVTFIKQHPEEFMEELDEIQASQKKKQKQKQERTKHINKLTKLKPNQRDVRLNDKNNHTDVPYYTPPSTGILYKDKASNYYLVITTHEEIELAKEIKSNYENAKICVKP